VVEERRRQRLRPLFQSREAPQRAGRGAEVLQSIEVEQHGSDTDALELLCGSDIGAGIVEHDEIWLACGDGFDIRRHPIADAGNTQRRGWIVAPLRAAHDAITSADREQQLGE